MSEPRITPEGITSPVFKIRGQRSRWRYGNERLTPEHCEILRDVNLSEEGVAESRYGKAKYNSTILAGGETAVGIWQGTFANGTTRTVIVTPTKVYVDDGTTRTDITGSALTGTVDDRVRFNFIKDKLIIDNRVDDIRFWAGDTGVNTADLTTVPFTKVTDSFVHNNLMMVAGTTESGTYFPTRLRWCDIDRKDYIVDVNTWPAGNLYEVYDGGPKIVGVVDNWGLALVFKEDGLYPGQIVYGPLGHFDFRLSRPKRGFHPVSRDSIVARPEFVFGAAREGLFAVFNTGTEDAPQLEFQIVNNDDVKEWLALNKGRHQYAQSFVREKDHQVRVLCSSADNSTGHDYIMVWDWETGDTWIDRPSVKVNYGASVQVANEELDLLGGTDSYLYKGNKSTYSDDDGTSFNWRIKMAPNDLGAKGSKHVLNLVTLHKKKTGQQSVSLRVHIDQGREGNVLSTLTLGTNDTWNSGLKWNSGRQWPGASAQHTSAFVNRICTTIAPEWESNNPSGIEGYIVEYIPLEG